MWGPPCLPSSGTSPMPGVSSVMLKPNIFICITFEMLHVSILSILIYSTILAHMLYSKTNIFNIIFRFPLSLYANLSPSASGKKPAS